jgi:dihydropteroate synthase
MGLPDGTLVMGVVNTTPDSFSDGGKHLDPHIAIRAALQMIDDGASIVDIGGESTRPGSSPVDASLEIRRVLPVVSGIMKEASDAVISVDTRRRVVAEAAIKQGAKIINDISGFRDDPTMVDLAREAGAGLVAMHILGLPKTMQTDIRYNSFPGDIYDFFVERINYLENSGIDPDRIAVDPGIGFGKKFDQNLVLINRLDFLAPLGKSILIGPSRKAFLGKILDEPEPARRDIGTLAAITASVMRGASIVRVHDVFPAVQACKVADAIIRERISS